LTVGGKYLLEKIGGSKKIENWEEYFLVANCTEYDNFVYNSSNFLLLASLADYFGRRI